MFNFALSLQGTLNPATIDYLAVTSHFHDPSSVHLVILPHTFELVPLHVSETAHTHTHSVEPVSAVLRAIRPSAYPNSLADAVSHFLILIVVN